MKKILPFLLVCLVLVACSTKQKEAGALLQEAELLYNKQEYGAAKQLLDSLKLTYPKQFAEQRSRLELVKRIEWAEQERNLAFCDSMLLVAEPELVVLKKNFVVEKEAEYEDLARLVHTLQVIERNVQRSYLRVWTNELGNLFLASVYYGSTPLHHRALRVETTSGEYAQTDNMPVGGGNNYSFVDGGMTTEVVTYTNEKDQGVLAFLVNHEGKEAVNISYVGDRDFKLPLSKQNIQAIRETYSLAVALQNVEKLKAEKKVAQAKLGYLKEKMTKGEE